MIWESVKKFIAIFLPAISLIALVGTLLFICVDNWQTPLAAIGIVIYFVATIVYLVR